MEFTLTTDRAYYVWSPTSSMIHVWAGEGAVATRDALDSREQRLWDAFPGIESSEDLPPDAAALMKEIEMRKPHALSVINVYDYAKGAPRITTREEFEAKCHEWEDALDESEFQKYFENN